MIIPVYRWRSWGSERLNHSSRFASQLNSQIQGLTLKCNPGLHWRNWFPVPDASSFKALSFPCLPASFIPLILFSWKTEEQWGTGDSLFYHSLQHYLVIKDPRETGVFCIGSNSSNADISTVIVTRAQLFAKSSRVHIPLSLISQHLYELRSNMTLKIEMRKQSPKDDLFKR